MVAYYFRVMQDGKPNGYRGLVFSDSMENLPYAIDEYVNPLDVEIKKANHGGYCKHVKVTVHIDDDDEDYEVEQTKFEFGEEESLVDEDEGWKKPNWKNEEHWLGFKKLGLS